jgi:hypothetical protein
MNRRQQENGHPRARPSRARAAAAATREQGGPQSRAQGPPRANLPPHGFGPRRRQRGEQDGGNDTASTALSSLAALQDNATQIAKGNPQFPRRCPAIASTPAGHGRCSHPPRWRPPPGLPLPFAALRVCHSLGQLLGSSRGRHALVASALLGQARAGRSFVAQRNPVAQAAQPGYGRALGGALVAGSKRGASSKAQNCIGRQQGSLFPAPLHSTVWATTKNWTRQRRK